MGLYFAGICVYNGGREKIELVSRVIAPCYRVRLLIDRNYDVECYLIGF